MASINFKCFQAYTLRAQAWRQLLIGRRALNPFGRPTGHLGLCYCRTLPLEMVHSASGFWHTFCRNYHTELGNPPIFATGTVNLHGEAGNNCTSDSKWTDEQLFLKELNHLHSSKDIFKFVGALESLSDTMVAAALQRVCDVEMEDSRSNNPGDIVEDETFRSLCFQLEQESQNLSDSGLVSSLNALIKLRVDPWSTLVVRLVSESQERLDKGRMTIQDLCILGDGLLDLEGSDCVMLEQIMEQVQSADLEDWKVDEIVMVYRMLQRGVGERGKYQNLLNKMNSFTITQVSHFSPKLLSAALHSLVVLDQTRAIPLVIKLCKHSVRHVPHFTEDELVNVLEAFIHFGHNDQYFTEALERHVAKHAFSMHPTTVSKVMQYCSKKHILSKTIFNVVAESFIYNADKFTTAQIAELVVPFGKLNYLPSCAPSLFRKLERTLSTRFAQFQPRVLLNLLHSCTLVERYPLNFLAKVFSPYFLQQLQGMPITSIRHLRGVVFKLFLRIRGFQGLISFSMRRSLQFSNLLENSQACFLDLL